jgi:hypothetical protein
MTGQFGKNHFGDKDEFLPRLEPSRQPCSTSCFITSVEIRLRACRARRPPWGQFRSTFLNRAKRTLLCDPGRARHGGDKSSAARTRRGTSEKSAPAPGATSVVTAATPSSASPKPAPSSKSRSGITSATVSPSQAPRPSRPCQKSSSPEPARPKRHDSCPSYLICDEDVLSSSS